MNGNLFNPFDRIVKIVYCKTCLTEKGNSTWTISCAESEHEHVDCVILGEAEKVVKEDFIPKSKIDELEVSNEDFEKGIPHSNLCRAFVDGFDCCKEKLQKLRDSND